MPLLLRIVNEALKLTGDFIFAENKDSSVRQIFERILEVIVVSLNYVESFFTLKMLVRQFNESFKFIVDVLLSPNELSYVFDSGNVSINFDLNFIKKFHSEFMSKLCESLDKE